MLNLKNKISYETSGAESSAKQLSPRPVLNKSKKGKETKLPPTQNLNRDAQMNKAKHKAGSKSNLQFYEQKHNNSPIEKSNEENQSRCINAYSFTNLLQKNLKTQQFSIHSNTSSLDIQSLPSAYPGSSEFKKPHDTKKMLSNTYITPACISTSHQRDSTIREQSSSSNTMLLHEHSKSRDKESQHEKRTSIKLVNMNKLSNTPKLKDMRESKSKDCKEKDNKEKEVRPKQHRDKEKEKVQNKTFRAVLNSNINKSLQEKQINLECSEKMYKFIKENSDFQDQNRKNYNGVASNSKSNLLSTGFLNIGNPLQNYDGLLSYRATERSKQSQGSKQIPRSSISEDYINEFVEEDSQVQSKDTITNKLSLLLQRVNSLQFYYSNSLERYDLDDMMANISSNSNHEKSKNERIQQKINCLTGFKERVLCELSSLIKKISEFSENIVNQLNYSIKVLEDSKSSSINWTAIQHDFSKKDRMSILMCKNQILLERLKEMSSCSVKSSIKTHKKFESIFMAQSTLDEIEQELVQQETFISDRQTLPPVVCLTPLILGQLELIDSKILDFRDNMGQMDKQWLQLSVQ